MIYNKRMNTAAMMDSTSSMPSDMAVKMHKTVKKMEKMLSQCIPSEPSAPMKSVMTRSRSAALHAESTKSTSKSKNSSTDANANNDTKPRRGRPKKSNSDSSDSSATSSMDLHSQVLGMPPMVQKKRGRPPKKIVPI
jgi:hypothetical protein